MFAEPMQVVFDNDGIARWNFSGDGRFAFELAMASGKEVAVFFGPSGIFVRQQVLGVVTSKSRK